jgi:hypothetical protein
MNNQIIKSNGNDSFITLEAGKVELTPEIIRNSISNIEKAMLGLPSESKLALETMHTFADGLYTRTVLMKSGSLICGKIHKLEHIVVIGQGSASVVSEEIGSKFISAPMVFMSRPMVKRLLFIHSDMIWTTVHKNPTNTRDLDELESYLIASDYVSQEGQ